MARTVNIGFLGCGNIGCGVWHLLQDISGEIESRAGLRFEVKRVLVRNPEKNRGIDAPRELFTTNVNEVIHDPDITIVMEFLGGDEPAHAYVVEALRAGKTVVTANKVAFALHWHEYHQAARESGSGLYYEAAVCGAIPIIHALEDSLQANRIDQVFGIVNGTTNYILSRMSAEGADYQDVLADAQRLGLAEPDPSSDVEGYDAAYKLSILSTLAFHGHVPFEHLYVEGITRMQAEDIRITSQLGYCVKLLAIAKSDGEKVEARVHPTLIRKEHPLSNVSGAFNAVFLHGHACGDMMFMGRGAGDMPTASALVSDLERAAEAQRHKYPTFEDETVMERNGDWECPFYLRVTAADHAGVLGAIAQTFARFGISIASMQQMSAKDGRATLVFLTHRAHENAMQEALKALPGETVHVKALIRMEE